MQTFTGTVLAAKLQHDGKFAVTLGPPPHLAWFLAERVPRLGSEVTVTARLAETRPVSATAAITILGGVRSVVVKQTGDRVVPETWRVRVQRAMRRPLLGYQVTGAGWMASRLAEGKGAICADDPGAGKTAQSIAAVCATRLFPVLVVCPKNVKVNWAREWSYSALAPRVVVLEGTRIDALPPASVYILNYHLLAHRERQLGNLGFRACILDEAHELAQPKPGALHRAAVATRLATWIGPTLLLTGSPLRNRPAELWRLLHMADPVAWPDLDHFLLRYCRAPTNEEQAVEAPQRRIVTSYARAERLDELQTRIDEVTIRRRKEDVLKELPPKSRRSVLVELDPIDRKAYREAERDVVEWLRRTSDRVTNANSVRARALVKLTHLRQLAALAKLRSAVPRYLYDWFSQEGRPLVVFAHHRRVVSGLVTLCRSMKLVVATFLPGASEDDRQRAVDQFSAGQAHVFVGSLRAAGVGLNLQVASDLLFLERLWTPTDLEQAEDRCYRLGQTRPVVATYLDAKGTVDEHLADVLDQKQTLIRRVVDDRATRQSEAFAIVDRVLDEQKRTAARKSA